MKLQDIKVNAAKLKLIIGENINFPFPQEKYHPRPEVTKWRTLQVSLHEILTGSSWARKRSHDERFDNKHPLELSLESIKEKGLNKSIVSNIRNDYKCQKAGRIVGKWAILNHFITDQHRKHISDLLIATADANIRMHGKDYYGK